MIWPHTYLYKDIYFLIQFYFVIFSISMTNCEMSFSLQLGPLQHIVLFYLRPDTAHKFYCIVRYSFNTWATILNNQQTYRQYYSTISVIYGMEKKWLKISSNILHDHLKHLNFSNPAQIQYFYYYFCLKRR